MNDRRRPVITAPGTTLLTWTPSLIPCSAKALASAMIAALIVATAAKPGFGSRAALPEMNATVPFAVFSASQARIVTSCTVQFQGSAVFPLLVRHLEQIDLRHRACNVYQSVDSAKAVERALNEGLGRARLAQIERVSQGLGATRLHRTRSFLEFVLPPRREDNSFKIARETYRRRAANTLARAGDDGNGVNLHSSPLTRPYDPSVARAASRITPIATVGAVYIGL